MIVAHILGPLNPSGAETMLRIAHPLWVDHGIRASHIISTGDTTGPYAPVLAEAGYAIHHCPFEHSSRWILPLLSCLKRIHPDVVHIQMERAYPLTSFAARCCGAQRIVRTIHSSFPFTGSARAKALLFRTFARSLGVIPVAIGRSVALNERRFGQRCRVVPNWFDQGRFDPNHLSNASTTRRSLGIPDSAHVLTLVGNCSAVKNHQWLFDLLADSADPDVWCVHVGHGSDTAAEQATIKDRRLGGRVLFLGQRSDVPDLLAASDAFIMPSLYEGFGIAALEALAIGLPCLLSDVAGLRDWAGTPGVSLFDLSLRGQDRVKAFRAWMDRLPSLRMAAIEHAPAIHSMYAASAGVAKYARLYGCRVRQNTIGGKHPESAIVPP